MTREVLLHPGAEESIRALAGADIVVGIPSFNNASTIGHVVRAAAAGCVKYFPGQKAVIVNSDGGSSDGTPDVVAKADPLAPWKLLVSHEVSPVHRIVTPYHGIPGKGSAFRTIFAVAKRLQARALALVDADLRSITPEWMELLLGPVMQGGFDFVAPLYLRHKYDGTITNSIVYPLTRALYGKEIRQPIGGDFGLSGRLAAHYLEKPVWDSHVARFGIDIWMTTTALAEGFRVCEAFLGAKIHDPKDPGADLSAMLVQVVSSVFDLMEAYHERWSGVVSPEGVPLFGFPHGVGLEPVNVDVERMLGIFREGARSLGEVWARALPESVLERTRALACAPNGAFRLDDPLWVRIVYDFALAYHRRLLPREQLLASLVPLYLGRTASFVLETRTGTAEEVEGAISALAEAFVSGKPYLVKVWGRGETPCGPPS